MSPGSLAIVSRNWATMLDSGVEIVKATRLSAKKATDAKLRRAMGGVADDLAAGRQVGEALERTKVFPELFVDLIGTAEQAGAVPETLRSLADHYDNVVKLRREFRSQILPSALQGIAATLIIALVIYVLGLIADNRGGEAMDFTGLGLSGGTGALLFLLYVTTAVAILVGGYLLLTRSLATAQLTHRVLLAVPVIGSCMRDFALARFSWAYALTQDAGLPVKPSLEAALRATGNGAFRAESDFIIDQVMSGTQLSEALEPTQLFPEQYLEMVRVGETSGTVPEQLRRMSPSLEADARRSLARLSTALSWAVWALVSGFIIYIIFRFALMYVGMINDAAQGL